MREERLIGGRFELLDRLGAGGMGTVWRARDLTLEREVALKEVRAPEGLDEDEAGRLRARALREARALARIRHPSVVTVHEVIENETYPWIVMELVPGESLQDALDQGDLRPREAAEIGLAVLAALHAAHAAGVLHRDVKPANVLLGPGGRVVLTDFGIAAVEGSTPLTATGSIVGSPEYLAPERVMGHAPRPAADLWSLGMLLYVAVEGYSPFRRVSMIATLAAVLHEPLPGPRRAGALAPIIEGLLAKDPDERPAGDDLAARLDAIARTTAAATAPLPPEPQPHPVAGPGVPVPEPRRRAVPVLAVVAVIALIAAGAVTALVLTRDDDKSPAATNTSTATTPAPSTTVTVTAPAPTGPSDRWVAQLAAVSQSGGVAKREAMLAEVRRDVPDAQVLDSNAYASFQPNYWVAYASGPFSDGNAVLAYCRTRGRTDAAECVGRWVSNVPADGRYFCAPTPNGTTGVCRRD